MKTFSLFTSASSYEEGESMELPLKFEDIVDMYYDKKSRDFGLLMDLLAESSGLVQPLRILSMFDRHFQALWRPRFSTIKCLIHCSLGSYTSIWIGRTAWPTMTLSYHSMFRTRMNWKRFSFQLRTTIIHRIGFNPGHLGGLCNG